MLVYINNNLKFEFLVLFSFFEILPDVM
uniref:Uncharacterized protein n=1 Tax=Heterorhabditis bacteriophora TaxID=37862 RepID=A0A1I7WI52_HETBA